MTWQEKILEKIKIIKCLKRERGSILVLTAVLLPILFGCLGIAYDVGTLYMHKARLQNVTDAAALAGGRAYLQSQKKDNNNDKDTYDPYTNGNITDEEYVIGGSKTRVRRRPGEDIPDDDNIHTFHLDADNAADVYIYNNIINLGNKVYSDKFSHYALPGYKKRGDDYVNADEIFYRIGLYEKVPLYFLPVITNKNVEIVRAGSVVVVVPEKTTTTIIPGSGSGSSTVTHPSIFDNLFTYSQFFESGLATTNNQINGTFIGNMVFTYGDAFGSDNAYYNMDAIIAQVEQNGYVDHLFTDPSTNLSDITTNGNSSGWSNVNDPIINTYFNTTAYVEAFRSKLNQPHVDVKKDALTDANINDYNSTLYKSYAKVDGNMVYKGRTLGTPFVIEGGDYYACDINTSEYIYVNGLEHTATSRVVYKQCYNMWFATVKDGNRYYLLNENYIKTNCYIDGWQAKLVNGASTIDLNNDSNDNMGWFYQNASTDWKKIYLNDNLNLLSPSGIKLLAGFKEDLQNQNSDYYEKQVISNIFHVSEEFQDHVRNVTINIQNPITVGDDPDEPIYILIEDNINEGSSSVRLNIKNNYYYNGEKGRPIIVVYFGTKNILLENNSSDINLTVYAPYGTFGNNKDNEQINFTGTFHGSVVAKHVGIQAGGGGTWIQENFLTNDEDIRPITQEIENNIKNAETIPDSIKSEIIQTYASALGVDKDSMNEPNWYSKQSYANKQQLYGAWKSLVTKYPQYRNQLWPWNEHFNIESGEDQTIITTTPEILRLINYRTDYQPKETIQENDVLDPYIYETLGQPNTY